MNYRLRTCLLFFQVVLLLVVPAFPQVMTKAQVSDVIKRVEDGVDDFQEYLEKRGEDARDRASAPEAQEKRGRRSSKGTAPSEERKALARENKDELEEAMDDLEDATDRLRRRFRRAGNYMDTKNQVDNVVDEAREINKVVERGNYGSEVSRIWAALRKGINDLARAYGVTPLAI
jgi:hypothetical protein